MTTARLRIGLAIAISCIFLASVVVDFLVPSYQPPPSIQALMMLVAGWVFGSGIKKGLEDE